MTGHSEVRAHVPVYCPNSAEMKITRGTPGASDEGEPCLDIAPSVYIAFGGDRNAGAGAMRTLDRLASEVAAELERGGAR